VTLPFFAVVTLVVFVSNAATEKPNIIYILADDMGQRDVAADNEQKAERGIPDWMPESTDH